MSQERVDETVATATVLGPQDRLEVVTGSLTLRVIEGADRGRVFTVRGTRITAGRRNADLEGPVHAIELEDSTVSSTHFELLRSADGAVVLRDLGSKNGTWIGGASLRPLKDSIRVFPYRHCDRATRFWAGSVLLQLETVGTEKRPVYRQDSLGELQGGSQMMREIYSTLSQIAPKPIPVFITGETGSGKEAVARTIHGLSGRSGPFVTLDCTMLSSGTAEAQIMGHAKGAFTGADVERVGFFEKADGGTIFVDELCELPLALQPKLLRVLDRGEVTRVGETTPRRVNARLISATNRCIEQEVAEGRFREDLFHRIGSKIELPPLRDRREDIPLLARHFAAVESKTIGVSRVFSRRALALLQEFDWQGNVRQLRHVVRQTVHLSEHSEISVGELRTFGLDWGSRKREQQEQEKARLPLKELAQRSFDRVATAYCLELLEEVEGDVRRAAAEAGYSFNGFKKMLGRLGLTGEASLHLGAEG